MPNLFTIENSALANKIVNYYIIDEAIEQGHTIPDTDYIIIKHFLVQINNGWVYSYMKILIRIGNS